MFGAYLPDGTLAGVAGLLIPTGAKLKHKAFLWGMYVRPAARGTALAAGLLAHVVGQARGVVGEVRLEVSPDNETAIRLYKAAGFRIYAREPEALKVRGEYVDSLFMRLKFRR